MNNHRRTGRKRPPIPITVLKGSPAFKVAAPLLQANSELSTLLERGNCDGRLERLEHITKLLTRVLVGLLKDTPGFQYHMAILAGVDKPE